MQAIPEEYDLKAAATYAAIARRQGGALQHG
jgi:hypothetical protein